MPLVTRSAPRAVRLLLARWGRRSLSTHGGCRAAAPAVNRALAALPQQQQQQQQHPRAASPAPPPVLVRRGYARGREYVTPDPPGTFESWGRPYFGSGGGGRSTPANTVIKFVPQQEAWIVERMGRFNRILEPGLAILIPFLDRIAYVKSLKEQAIDIPQQSAITQDNVTLELDGVLYVRVVDPYKASYGVEDAEYAVAQLAQTTMRAEIGQMTLDRTLAERNRLNANIVQSINSAAFHWGIECLRYEIRDIQPPARVVESMHQQVSAERTKRAQILESEGSRQAAINVAEGRKQATILASEADKAEKINMATGDSEAILLRARASSTSIQWIAEAIKSSGGQDAVAMTIAEKYVEAFGMLAKEGTTVVVPAGVNDVSAMVVQALSVYNTVSKQQRGQREPSESAKAPFSPRSLPVMQKE